MIGIWALAAYLAVGGHRRIGRLIGDGEAGETLRLQLLELAVVGRAGARGGEHGGQRKAGAGSWAIRARAAAEAVVISAGTPRSPR